MKAKYKIISAFLLLLPLVAIGQMEKGWMLVGGSVGFHYQVDNEIFTIGIHPNHGFFVKDNLVVGAAVDLSVVMSEGEGIWIYGASPFVRYYFTQNKANPFISARVGMSGITDDEGNSSELYNGGLSLGMAYFVSKTVAVEMALNYDHVRTGFEDGDIDNNDFNIGVGLQVHLERFKSYTQEERAKLMY